MTASKAAWLAGVFVIAIFAAFLLATSEVSDPLETLAATVLLGGPYCLAVAGLVHRFLVAGGDGDFPARLVSATTADLPTARQEWGDAMRAELASIEEPRARRRFAVGCAGVSLRTGVTRESVMVAAVVAVSVAVVTLAASRISLDGSRAGIMVVTLYIPTAILFVTALLVGWTRRSFRSAVMTGMLALVLSLVALLVVAMAEGALWQRVAGVFLIDGDAPSGGVFDPMQGALDPVRPIIVIFHLVTWLPWPVLGAIAGTRLADPASSRMTDDAPASNPASDRSA